MALNIDTLKTRSLTAVFFVMVMLAGLLWNFWSFLILFSIIHIGCWYEFVKLHELITHKKNTVYLYLGLLYISLPIILLLLLGMQWKSVVSVDATQADYTYLFPCAIIFSIWINDTMAYIVG